VIVDGPTDPQSAAGSAPPAAGWRPATVLEDSFASLALLVMVALPLLEIFWRKAFGHGIPGAGPIVQHLTLWVGFLGAAMAARDGKLLALASGSFLPAGWGRQAARILAAAFGAWAAALLVWGGWQLVSIERETGSTIGADIPTWIAQLVLPISMALIAARLVWRAARDDDQPESAAAAWLRRGLSALGIAIAVLFVRAPSVPEHISIAIFLIVLLAAAAAGTPLFAILGGAAAFLFMHDGVTPATILIETYSLSVSPTLAAIPLFTLAGFLLAEGKASDRLLRVFRAWFGWVPGGTAVVCAILCSFFTVFTGGSGVTILALGGVLFPALVRDGYRERFSLGLLTASGSLGLLLPPALPLIVYAVVAQIPIEDIFIGGILPGILMTSMIAAWGVREGIVSQARRQPFRFSEALGALWNAKWELAMPGVVLAAILSGAATAVEASALTALYALVVQAVIHRDVSPVRDLSRVLAECITVVGGVLIIVGVAVGMTNYLVGAQVPAKLVQWTQGNIHSQFAFLLALNLFLLIVGALMDMFAAIVVVVPLIVPLGAAFGVHPVHLGIIFIANLELGFLTPPVGLNLFLASYRFKKPMLEVCAAALPMMAILGVGVLVITYVPWLTTGLLAWFGR
jgi:tripartite ATP-independent transporter DctM subunit